MRYFLRVFVALSFLTSFNVFATDHLYYSYNIAACVSLSGIVSSRNYAMSNSHASCDSVPDNVSTCSTGNVKGPFNLYCHDCAAGSGWNGSACVVCPVGQTSGISVPGCIFDVATNPQLCVKGQLSHGCAVNCAAVNGFPEGQVGYGQSCPSAWPIYKADADGDGYPDYLDAPNNYGCVSRGVAHQCDPNFKGGPNSIGNNQTSQPNTLSSTAAAKLNNISTGAGSNAGNGGANDSTDLSQATDFTIDFCRYYPDSANCAGYQTTDLFPTPCANGGPRIPNVGCDYNYNPPSNISCPSGYQVDNFGSCQKLPSVPYVTQLPTPPTGLPAKPDYATSTISSAPGSTTTQLPAGSFVGSHASQDVPDSGPAKPPGPCDPTKKDYDACLGRTAINIDQGALQTIINQGIAQIDSVGTETINQFQTDITTTYAPETYRIIDDSDSRIWDTVAGGANLLPEGGSGCSALTIFQYAGRSITIDCSYSNGSHLILAWLFGAFTFIYVFRTFFAKETV